MKINVLRSFLALIFSLLCGYGFWSLPAENPSRIPIAIAIFICVFTSMEIVWGIEFKEKRGGIMIKTASSIWGCCLFVLDSIFLWTLANLSVIIIVNGGLLLLLLLCVDFLYKSKM